MSLVASIYGLPPRVLPSIQATEGGSPGLAIRNTNGTEDLGVMQINTVWLDPLARYTGLSHAEVRDRLLIRPCFNIAAAGAILRYHLDRSGGDVMTAVGNYHSHTPPLHSAYRLRVIASAARLFQSGQPTSNAAGGGPAQMAVR